MLDGAFVLLEELARAGEAGPSGLAEAARLPKATAHRLLGQLAGVGAVESRSGRYRIGPRMFHVGEGWRPAAALRAAALPPLRQLAASIGGASVNVSVVDAGQMLIVAAVRGDADDVVELRPGFRLSGQEFSCVSAVSSAPVVHAATGGVVACVNARVLGPGQLAGIEPLVRRAANIVSARLATTNPALFAW
ncbi:hypothetical protein AOZ06_03000 [Kibdelosporangium phytohabitans]|uniref:HTH iclR-type domain-containing protein n=1 Tax=Kibdelosporangium phytohabitans TaxID=860235 RepID=A0A0N9HNZ0_9PSEU|nr:hypothetical protein AOZ06_03000 [Kibdelosporangium phytohabitans]